MNGKRCLPTKAALRQDYDAAKVEQQRRWSAEAAGGHTVFRFHDAKVSWSCGATVLADRPATTRSRV